jgi:hypothetical protein
MHWYRKRLASYSSSPFRSPWPQRRESRPEGGLSPSSSASSGIGTILRLLALVLMLSGAPAQADIDPYRLYLAERGDIPWESLSPEEQQALKRYRGQWDGYSSERQQRLRQGAQRYMDLPPDKRREVEQQRREYEQLSPQERERLRKEYQRRRN